MDVVDARLRTTRPWAAAALRIAAVILLGSCGDNGEQKTGGSAAFDPCTLITADEAGRALGDAVDVDRPGYANRPPALFMCRYTAQRDGTLAVMTVMVRKAPSLADSKSGFEATRGVMKDAQPVDGIGDQAFIASGQLNVLSGDTILVVSGDFDDEKTRQMARQALTRLSE